MKQNLTPGIGTTMDRSLESHTSNTALWFLVNRLKCPAEIRFFLFVQSHPPCGILPKPTVLVLDLLILAAHMRGVHDKGDGIHDGIVLLLINKTNPLAYQSPHFHLGPIVE